MVSITVKTLNKLQTLFEKNISGFTEKIGHLAKNAGINFNIILTSYANKSKLIFSGFVILGKTCCSGYF